MRWFRRLLIGSAVFLTVLIVVVLYQVGTPFPKIEKPRDVFGFANLDRRPAASTLPALKRFEARDGSELSYRFYPSSAERILIFVHGSSYHGAAYHELAQRLAEGGAAKVVLPNLRGHYQSGRRRGDVDYIGQLEDDLADLIGLLRGQGHEEPVLLGGHSSGGGFTIRFAGGPWAHLVSGYLLLAPVIPTSPAVKGGDAGGWANLHRRRLFGLIVLGMLGFHGLDGLPIIEFNKPEIYWDGSETLSYSYRLNSSYHPRYDYEADLRAIPADLLLVIVGQEDEAVDGLALQSLIAQSAPGASMKILSGVDHFGVFSANETIETVALWLQNTKVKEKP